MGRAIILALKTAHLGGMLRHRHVVVHGNHNEHGGEDQCQRDHLHRPSPAIARRMAQPKPEHRYGERDPFEIED